MGLFNLFGKKKEESDGKPDNSEATPQSRANSEPDKDYSLLTLPELVAIPKVARNDIWQKTFLDKIVKADLFVGNTKISNGPDGLPYYQLFMPESSGDFTHANGRVVIDYLKRSLLSSGHGIAINPGQNKADWVFSYGDISSYHLYGQFYVTSKTLFGRKTDDANAYSNEGIMYTQPSDMVLPKQTRKLIGDYLIKIGIENPQVFLVKRQRTDGDGIAQHIVFNVSLRNCGDEKKIQAALRTIAWYLPMHYTFLGIDEQGYESVFVPL